MTKISITVARSKLANSEGQLPDFWKFVNSNFKSLIKRKQLMKFLEDQHCLELCLLNKFMMNFLCSFNT